MSPDHHTITLAVVDLAERARLRDQPGDMERQITQAIARAAAELSRLAQRDRIILFTDEPSIEVHVQVRVSGAQVPEEVDIEEVRRHVSTLPRSVWSQGVLWSQDPPAGAW